jgi:hypothetical protein
MIPVAWKEIGAKTLSQIWGTVAAKKAGKKSFAMQIAENDPDAGMGVTSLLVQKDGAPEIVHVLSGLGDTLVVSGAVSKDFGELLKRQGVVHVDYNSPSAAAAIDAHVEKSGTGSDAIDSIKQAFLLRNGIDSKKQKDMKRSLGAVMTDVAGVPPVAPVYVAATAPKTIKKRRTP